MNAYRAAWVVPIAGPPLPNATVIVERDRIVGVVREAPALAQSWAEASASVHDLGRVALLPGLVNAHTHLELSWMRDRVRPRASFDEWVRELMRLRKEGDPVVIQDALVHAITAARAFGTSLVGDISNTLSSAAPLLASDLGGVVFREAIGFLGSRADEVVSQAVSELAGVPWTDRVRGALAAHAPYSVSPAVFRKVAEYAAHDHRVTTVHIAESPEEVVFVRTGTGAPRKVLEDLQAWDPAWQAPGCSPIEYLDRLGFLGPRTTAVHAVQATPEDLALLRRRGTTVVTCPRSNRWTGVGDPPMASFFASGVRVAIGTDSLASAPDLNIFAELAAARQLAPNLPARDLLSAATLNGAEAIGFGATHGSIEPGKHADLITVTLPPDVDDVEEYLVSGIMPGQVAWLSGQS